MGLNELDLLDLFGQCIYCHCFFCFFVCCYLFFMPKCDFGLLCLCVMLIRTLYSDLDVGGFFVAGFVVSVYENVLFNVITVM